MPCEDPGYAVDLETALPTRPTRINTLAQDAVSSPSPQRSRPLDIGGVATRVKTEKPAVWAVLSGMLFWLGLSSPSAMADN